MNYLKRAFVSITRNIGKGCLLFLIVLILGSVISGAITTNQATENMETNLVNSMLPIAMVEVDWDKFHELAEDPNQRVSSLSTDLIREIGALPYVKSYDYFTGFGLFGPYEQYEPEVEGDDVIEGGRWVQGESFGTSHFLRGVQNPNIMDMEHGLIELVNGRVFTADEVNNLSTVALISEEFARLNNLTVGSTLSLRNVIFTREAEMRMWDDYLTEEDVFMSESYDIEVIGIFRPISLPDMDDPWSTRWLVKDMHNRIYVPNSFAEVALRFSGDALREVHPEIFGDMEDDEWVWWENFFTLHNPAELPQFREAVESITPAYFRVLDTGHSLRPVLLALDTMRGFTMMILIVAIGAALTILTLLIMLFLRDRRREVGIYLALGEKKRKIISQFLVEIVTVSFIAILAALFIGNILANNVSENMLMNDIAMEQERVADANIHGGHWDRFAAMGFQTDVSDQDIVDSYDVSLSPFTLLLFFGVGFGTILLATVIPMIYVLQMNPKKIML